MSQTNSLLEQTIVELLTKAGEGGLSVGELTHELGPDNDQKYVAKATKRLSRHGILQRLDRGLYAIRELDAATTGKLEFDGKKHFVEEDGEVVTIPSRNLGKAVAGDTIEFIRDERRPRVASVGAITDHISRNVVGTLKRISSEWYAYAPTIGEPIVLSTKPPEGIKDGSTVKLRILKRSKVRDSPRGFPTHPIHAVIVESKKAATTAAETNDNPLSMIDPAERNASALLDQLAQGLGLSHDYPRAAVEVAAKFSAPTSATESGDDITHLALVTIDPDDAKDFDDALFAETLDSGLIRVWVAIADVSYYVTQGNALDEAAYERGFSVYMPGRVYPMLPAELSEDVCSLRPNVLRRCAWVHMDIDAQGDVKSYDAGFGVMKSQHRFTYDQAQTILEGGQLDKMPSDEILGSIALLDQARERLHKKRRRRGMLDLDLPEPRIQLSSDGARVEHALPYPRKTANRLVEECMLSANETIADLIASESAPGIYRVHKDPRLERLDRVRTLVQELKIDIEIPNPPSVFDMTRLLDKLLGQQSGRVISSHLLRALARAEYSTDDDGHFGIGARRYLHFTSPIRRYPDLAVHRVLRKIVDGDRDGLKVRWSKVEEALTQTAEHCNEREKFADSGDRLAGRILGSLAASDRVGETLQAVVTDVASFGCFVHVDDPFVDGLIPMRWLGEGYWVHNEEKMCIERNDGAKYQVGDQISVVCDNVEIHLGRVTFAAADPPRAKGYDRSRRPDRQRPQPGTAKKPSGNRGGGGKGSGSGGKSGGGGNNRGNTSKAAKGGPSNRKGGGGGGAAKHAATPGATEKPQRKRGKQR